MNIKRKVDSYEIIHAIQVGNREVVLGIDENNPAGLYYMCGFLYTNPNFDSFVHVTGEEYFEILKMYPPVVEQKIAGADYLEIFHIFLDRVKYQLSLVHSELNRIDVPFGEIFPDQCMAIDRDTELSNRIVAVRTTSLPPEYRYDIYQLVLVTGGMAAAANPEPGTKLLCRSLYSGLAVLWDREDLLGEVRFESLPIWAREQYIELKQEAYKNE